MFLATFSAFLGCVGQDQTTQNVSSTAIMLQWWQKANEKKGDITKYLIRNVNQTIWLIKAKILQETVFRGFNA